MKKIMLAAALLIILAIGAYFLFLNSENSETNNSWEYAKLKPGELIMLVSATGVVKPNFEVEVKSKASGEIIKFPLEEGDSVEAGTLMVELDKSDEKRNYRQAEAGLTSAQARYRQAQVDLKLEKKEYEVSLKNARSELDSAKSTRDTMKKKLDRLAELRQKNLISDEELESAQNSFESSAAKYQQAQGNLELTETRRATITRKEAAVTLTESDLIKAEVTLEEAEERLAETEIRAPISGVLIKKEVEEGQIISSGISSVSGGTALATLADLSSLYIEASVDETDIGQVVKGQPAAVTTDAYPKRKFQGTVNRIAPQGEVESNVVTFKVRIKITDKKSSLLKPNMTANVAIVVYHKKNVLKLPSETVLEKDDQRWVEIMDSSGKTRLLAVQVGLDNGTEIEILPSAELTPETLVLTSPSGLINKEGTEEKRRRGMWLMRKRQTPKKK